MPDLNLDELARLEQTATPAPWREQGRPNSDSEVFFGRGQYVRCGVAYPCNADLIVALRNAAPALLTTARNHDRLLAAVEAVCEARGVNAEDDALLEHWYAHDRGSNHDL